jgi:hypothetical protein
MVEHRVVVLDRIDHQSLYRGQRLVIGSGSAL